MSTTSIKAICLLLSSFLFSQSLLAHNGSVAYAYPLGKIRIDGDFSDWPGNSVK